MYEFASSSATLLTVYTAVMHTRRMNVIPEADLGTMIVVVVFVVAVPPRFRRQSPGELTTLAGDDVTLPCDVVADPSPLINWRKNHVPITTGDHRKYLVDDDSGSLVIRAADAGDSARYLCVAENVAGVATQEITLTVHGLKQTISRVFFRIMQTA